jgi:hypothetical protein
VKRTIAEVLGGTPHLSPVLRKARRIGLRSVDDLLRLAVLRGCNHYGRPDFEETPVKDPGPNVFTDLDLAIALCSGAQINDPLVIRCAAQLLGSEEINPSQLARRARMERCEVVVAHIATAAAQGDVGRSDFWNVVLADLGPVKPPKPGVLPHRSRFMLQSGIAAPNGRLTIWLRPKRKA